MTLFDTAELDVAAEREGQLLEAAPVRPVVWTRRTTATLVVALMAAAALAFARWQVALAVVPWDSKNHFYPMFRFLGDALRHGTLPLWNPYHFAGYPAVADPQSLLFTPSLALLAFLMPNASMRAFDAMILCHLVAGGVGMLGLCRRWRWHPAAALLSALIFVFGSSAASRLQHTGMIVSYSYFPLALWCLLAAIDRRSLGLATLAGATVALMALGRDQVAYLLCLALAGTVLREAFRASNAFAFLLNRAAVIGLAAMVTAALMAVPVLLTLQFLGGSNRPGIAYGMALAGSLDPVNLLTLVAPNVFGSLDRVYDYWGPGAATAAGNDWTDRSIDYLFAGSLPVVLLLWHGLAGSRVWRRGGLFFLLLLAASYLYAMGRFTPFFTIAFDWLPGVELYRRPADATFLGNIGLAFLGGLLLHLFAREGLPRRAMALPAAAATALAVLLGCAWLVGSGLAFAWQSGHFGRSFGELALSAVPALAIVTALVLGRDIRRRGLVAACLVGATAAQLIWFNAASPLNAEPASTYSAYDGLYPDQRRGLDVLRPELAARAARGEHPRIEILGVGGSWQNASMVFKFENMAGYNPLRIADYERVVGVAESSTDPKLRVFPNTFRGYNSHLAALFGLDYLVLDRPIGELPRHIPRPRGDLMFAGMGFFVYRLEGPTSPRAVLVPRAKRADTAPTFDGGCGVSLDPADLARLHDRSLLAAPPASAPGPTAATIASYADNEVVVDVDATTPGVLVLHDVFYPGWEATVDGVPAPVLKADQLFRGVEVAAGHHRVEFAFHPFSIANLTAAAAGALQKGRP